MTAEAIPVEILELIFKNLKGTDAITCRAVCRRWRDGIDNFSDDVWKQYCCRDFLNPKSVRARNVSNMSYRDLYKSHTLWSKVEEAEETCQELPDKHMNRFIVLNNNTLAVLTNDYKGKVWGIMKRIYQNIIEYYNIQTMKLISRQHYDYSFSHYDENEKLIVLVDTDLHLVVITKSNKKTFPVDFSLNEDDKNFALLDTEVYYINGRKIVCVARLKVVDGEDTIETEELKKFEVCIVAFARAKEGVNILTDDGDIYCYRYHDKDIEKCCQLIMWTNENIKDKLWEFGFHWSDPHIYAWLLSYVGEKRLKITKLDEAKLHAHNHVVLLGTCRRTVHVYKRPYNENGVLKMYKAKPNKIIHLRNHRPDLRGEIQQLDVVEILNGHRILVVCSNKLFFIDLLHNQHKEEREQQVCKKARLI